MSVLKKLAGAFSRGDPKSEVSRRREKQAERKLSAKGVDYEALEERLWGLADWKLRVKKMRNKRVLTARITINGKRVEKYIGTYDENTKKILVEEGYPLD